MNISERKDKNEKASIPENPLPLNIPETDIELISRSVPRRLAAGTKAPGLDIWIE